MTRGSLATLAFLVASIGLGGCAAGAALPSTIATCAPDVSAARCRALVAAGAARASIDPDRVRAVEILPRPTPQAEMDQLRGGVLELRLRLSDGSARVVAIACGGVAASADPACVEGPPDPSG